MSKSTGCKITIKQVSVEKILPLRQEFLREGYSLEESRFDHDQEKDTFHLALYLKEKIEAVATFMPDQASHSTSKNQYRLRGMAVSSEKQGQGFGKAVFEEGIRLLTIKDIPYLWFNARIHAVGFYKKLGCTPFGEEFVIPTAGPHYFMYKML